MRIIVTGTGIMGTGLVAGCRILNKDSSKIPVCQCASDCRQGQIVANTKEST